MLRLGGDVSTGTLRFGCCAGEGEGVAASAVFARATGTAFATAARGVTSVRPRVNPGASEDLGLTLTPVGGGLGTETGTGTGSGFGLARFLGPRRAAAAALLEAPSLSSRSSRPAAASAARS